MPVYKDRWPKHRPYSGNSPAEIVEHIMAVSPSPIIKNPIQPPLAATQTLSVISELECSICLHGCARTSNAASMWQTSMCHLSGRVDPPMSCALSLLSLHCTPGVQGCQSRF